MQQKGTGKVKEINKTIIKTKTNNTIMCKDLLTIGVLQYQQKQLEGDDSKQAKELSKAIYKFIRATYPEEWFEPDESEEGD